MNSHIAEVVRARDPEVATLMTALTDDLDSGGYAPEESFGYSVE